MCCQSVVRTHQQLSWRLLPKVLENVDIFLQSISHHPRRYLFSNALFVESPIHPQEFDASPSHGVPFWFETHITGSNVISRLKSGHFGMIPLTIVPVIRMVQVDTSDTIKAVCIVCLFLLLASSDLQFFTEELIWLRWNSKSINPWLYRFQQKQRRDSPKLRVEFMEKYDDQPWGVPYFHAEAQKKWLALARHVSKIEIMMLLVEFAPKQALGCWMLPQWQLPNVTAAPCLLKLQAPSWPASSFLSHKTGGEMTSNHRSWMRLLTHIDPKKDVLCSTRNDQCHRVPTFLSIFWTCLAQRWHALGTCSMGKTQGCRRQDRHSERSHVCLQSQSLRKPAQFFMALRNWAWKHHSSLAATCGSTRMRDLLRSQPERLPWGPGKIIGTTNLLLMPWPFSSLIYPLKMVIFHGYVSLPEGNFFAGSQRLWGKSLMQ